ncbi:MAG: DUF1127 domain-containing protein [Alphaproteobacteria bacterium]
MTMRAECLDRPPAAAFARARGLRAVVAAAFTRLAEWRERAEQRAHLAAMDERLLKDIGISAVEATREADKPFWKP